MKRIQHIITIRNNLMQEQHADSSQIVSVQTNGGLIHSEEVIQAIEGVKKREADHARRYRCSSRIADSLETRLSIFRAAGGSPST